MRDVVGQMRRRELIYRKYTVHVDGSSILDSSVSWYDISACIIDVN